MMVTNIIVDADDDDRNTMLGLSDFCCLDCTVVDDDNGDDDDVDEYVDDDFAITKQSGQLFTDIRISGLSKRPKTPI